MLDITTTLTQHLVSDLSMENFVNLKFPPPDATVELARKIFLLNSLTKKYTGAEGEPSKAACASAMEKFIAANERSSTWSLEMNDSIDETLFGEFKNFLYDFYFGSTGDTPLVTDYNRLFELGGIGPGASVSAIECDFYSKLFRSPISSCSDSLRLTWESLACTDPRWRVALDDVKGNGVRLVRGNSLSFVNKNVTTARTISTEPLVNMWFQLGMGRLIASRLKSRYSIEISKQQAVNGTLARIGSITDDLCTIDLESASDSISLGLVDVAFPRVFSSVLKNLRSPTTRLPDGSYLPLGMISTMGNGYTFPLQTLIFLGIAVSAYKVLGIKPQFHGPASHRNIGVYGDDIIVVKQARHLTLRLLKLLGFRVNAEKSFFEGPFRESCGQDFWSGHPVRGVYIKDLTCEASVYVAINTLQRWSAQMEISIPATLTFLYDLLGAKRKCVPLDEPDDAGIQVPLDRAWRVHHIRDAFGLVSYSKLTPKGRYYDVGYDSRGPSRNEEWSHQGLELAFLGGYIRGNRVALRQRVTRYVTKRHVTPSWNNVPPRWGDKDLSWASWSRTVRRWLPDA